MARPIQPTPPLRGAAARKFLRAAANPKPQAALNIDLKRLAETAKRIAEKHAAQ